ncbi:MAG: tetratricopeptide repeat protein [Bacteroidia bacterium]
MKNNSLKFFFLVIVSCLLSIVTSFGQGQSNLDVANQYFNTGEYDKAAVYFEKQYSADPFGTYEPYLKCLNLLKDFDKAEKLIKKQLKKNPADLTLYVDLGKLYISQNENDKAKQQFDKAIKSIPPDANQVINLGNAFVEIQEFDRAIETYLAGRKLLRGVYPFNFELAELYSQKGDQQKMIEEYLDVLNYNEQYFPNLQAILQNKIANDLTGNISEILRKSLLREIQRNSDRPVYNELLYWLFIQEKDFESAMIQAKAMDKRLDENGDRLLSLGRLSASNSDYELAEKCFQYVVDKGKKNLNYVPAKIEMLNASNKKITSGKKPSAAELVKLDKDYETTLSQLGKNAVTAPLISSYAHLKAFYLDKIDDAVKLLEEIIALPGIADQFKGECKLELGDILILQGEVWDAALYYGQVDKDFKHDAIGREAKFRNAKLSYYLGEFDWAAAQLNVLKAATSQLISNDAMALALLIMDNTADSNTTPLLIYSRADLLEFRNDDNKALTVLDSVLTQFPKHSLTDEVWYKKAEIFEKKELYDSAAVYFNDIVENYPDDILADDALFQLARLNENQLNNKPKAMEYYEKILTKYTGSLFAAEARKKFRALRGDKVN